MTTRLLLLLLFSCTAAVAQNSAHAQQAPLTAVGDSTEVEEPLRRYTVEFILFTYGPGISVGTEVFVAEQPAPANLDDAVSVIEPYFADSDPANAVPGALSDRQRSRNFTSPPGDPREQAPDNEQVPAYGDTMPLPSDDDSEAEQELETLPGADSIEMRILTSDELTMTGTHEKLLSLDAYRPVLWSGWTQVVREDDLTPTINLRRLGNVPLEFSGEVKLYLSRFLHLVVDLNLESPAVRSGARPTRGYRDSGVDGNRGYDYRRDNYGMAPPPVRYTISEDRIIKSNDIRYFDHPKFGMLAKLTRVEEPTQSTLPPVGSQPSGLTPGNPTSQ